MSTVNWRSKVSYEDMSKRVGATIVPQSAKWTELFSRTIVRRPTVSFKLKLTAVFLFALFVSASDVRADRYDMLRADQTIERGLLIVAIGDTVRDYCTSFKPRRVRGLVFLNGLVNRAIQLGYSLDEIRAYVDNEEEKSRVKALARQWLLEQGGDFNRPETLCQVARDEMAKNTQIGRLIREK